MAWLCWHLFVFSPTDLKPLLGTQMPASTLLTLQLLPSPQWGQLPGKQAAVLTPSLHREHPPLRVVFRDPGALASGLCLPQGSGRWGWALRGM